MRFIRTFLIVLLVSVTTIGCELSHTAVRGNGDVITDTQSVSNFSAVSLSGHGRLIIDRTGSESLTIRADKNLLPYLTAEVEDGVLRLGRKEGTDIRPSGEITYEIEVAALEAVSVSGSGEAIARNLDTDRFQFSVSGSGSLVATGRADRQEIEISGSGRYRADSLTGDVATVEIAGSGDVVVNVADQLDVRISGSGDVAYIGSPKVSQRIAGSGSVRPREP